MESLLNMAIGQEEMENRYLIFWLDEQLFGLPIESVVQIVQMQEIIRIPKAPAYEKGVIHLRGSIITVMDARLRLGKAEADYTERTCILACSVAGKSLGLIVDAVEEVMQIAREDISPAPALAASANDYMLGVARADMGMVLLLSPEKLWSL
ncbi:MAG: chemotaxis protein CheW [Candidatus Pelethousia sp.]|nr:chemotaxis protein CheW [Candidatus Pelethousia sp.]